MKRQLTEGPLFRTFTFCQLPSFFISLSAPLPTQHSPLQNVSALYAHHLLASQNQDVENYIFTYDT